MSDTPLDDTQLGVGDMSPDELRRHGREVFEIIAGYVEQLESLPVLAQVDPGELRARLPSAPPAEPEPISSILDDVTSLVVPGLTHWNHPAFHAYFAISGSGPGILGEALTAAFNVNGMLWRTAPIATELEEVALDWLRQLLALPQDFRGVIMDTASVATMVALAASREAAGLGVREQGMAGRADLPPLAVYTSEHAHSSVEKAAITLGLGQRNVRKIAVDDRFRMDPADLRRVIDDDLSEGIRPLAIVGTVGTTSTTSIDPIPQLADARDEVAARIGAPVWLHVDGAYGGVAAIRDDMRWILDGVDRADSFVTNPHKWLFTPIDCTAFYVRDPEVLKQAFSLVPEYLRTSDEDVTNYMDWGVQLGRRFRSLKLWMVMRYFGASGLRARIREHLRLAQVVVDWIEDRPDFELLAPTPFSTVCFRAAPNGTDADDLDRLNAELMRQVNASGEAYLSHTVLRDRYALRLAIGNLRTTEDGLRRTLELIQRTLDDLR